MSGERHIPSGEKINFPRTEKAPRPHSKEIFSEEERETQKEKAQADVKEALKHAEASEVPSSQEKDQQGTQHYAISEKQKAKAYKQVMSEAQQEMSPAAKAFSKVIHNPAVEATSEVVGKTIARPTSILTGSICAFLVLSGVYLLAKYNGFRLAGSEFILLFIAGWAAGLLIDFFRHMITGKN